MQNGRKKQKNKIKIIEKIATKAHTIFWPLLAFFPSFYPFIHPFPLRQGTRYWDVGSGYGEVEKP